MPISQREAQELLNCLEDSKKKPELILSDLFIHGVSGMNLLYEIYLDGEYICDYCKRQLLTLEIFRDCVIKQNSFEFMVYLKSEYKDGYLNDPIIKIDASEKTFVPQYDAIKLYQDALDNLFPERPEEVFVSEWWRKFENFSTIRRPKLALQVFCQSQGNIFQKIRDSLYMLYVPVETVLAAYKREEKKVKCFNDWKEERYLAELAEQKKLRAAAPEKIEMMKKKEQEISEYLMNLGYIKINRVGN